MTDESQSFELRVTPHGVVAPRPYTGDERWVAGITARFAEQEAAGLVALGATALPPHAHASVSFWRDVAANFLRALCHVPENEEFTPDDIVRY